MYRKLFAFLGLLVLTVFLWTAPAQALEIGTAEPLAWGGDDVWNSHKAVANIAFDKMQELGATSHRDWISWKDWQAIKPANGQPSLDASSVGMLDAVVAAGKERGISTYAVIYNAPQWANGSTNGVFIPGNGDPTNPEFQQFVKDYADFVYNVVSTYKGRIDHWEIWLEPDFSWNIADPPTNYNDLYTKKAKGYAYMLKETYKRVKEADSGSSVIMGGISSWTEHLYLNALYAEGAGAYFDIANIHPWTESPNAAPSTSPLFAKIGDMRNTMDAHGDIGKPIWITALGWSNTGSDSSRTVSESQKTEFTIDAIQTVKNRYPSVSNLTFFRLMDRAWYPSTDLEAGYGFLYTDVYNDGVPSGHPRYEPKPSFYALKSYLANTNSTIQLQLQGGDAFWAGYNDYLNKKLSVNFTVSNSGTGTARVVTVNRIDLTNGVSNVDSLPLTLGDINNGGSKGFTVRFYVPTGVFRFRTLLSGTAQDDRGATHNFP